MADLAQIIANIDGYRNYESNRSIDLANQAQNLQNQQTAQIMDLKTQLANLQNNPYAKWGIWDPQGRHQQLLNEDQQLKIASKWASSIKNLAPEKRAQGYAQFLKAMPSLGIDVSDMPQGYDEGYINQLADLGIETETRYQNEQQNARQERQIAATAANLERQIAANREARQDEFDKKLAAFDYEQGYKTRQEREKRDETDDYIRSLKLDDDTTNRLLAKSRGIELPDNEDTVLSLKEQSEIAKNLGLTADPDALNEGRFEYAAKPQANASGDAYLYQQMVNSGMSTEEALDRLGKMSPQTKFEQEIALKQVENDIATGGQIARDNNQFQNNVVLKGIEHQNQLELEERKKQLSNESEQLKSFLKMNEEQFKNSLPTAKMREYQETAQATGQSVNDLIKQDWEMQQLEAKAKQAQIDLNTAKINQAIAATDKTRKETQNIGTTTAMRNYQFVQANPEAANSPIFQPSGTNVTVNTGDVPESAVFDVKTLSKERAKQYVQDVDEYENMVSKMPELEATVERLKELAPIATYTKSGRVRDIISQELGMPTEQSIARDEYESIIANQILPLLRDTFGAQFTEREGNSLKATLGDPNKSAQSKVKVLDSFINQKTKSIASKFRKIQSYTQGIVSPDIQTDEGQIIDFNEYL